MGNTSYTAHISNKKSAITSKSKLLGVAKHNLRKYKPDDYSKDNIIVLRGTDDLLQDVKNVYHQEFDEVIKEYNEKQKRVDRKIDDYFEHVAGLEQDMAVEIIFQCGDKEFWQAHDDVKDKMYYVYSFLIGKLGELLPEFKIANAVIHFDEVSPHVHVVGVPVWEAVVLLDRIKAFVSSFRLFAPTIEEYANQVEADKTIDAGNSFRGILYEIGKLLEAFKELIKEGLCWFPRLMKWNTSKGEVAPVFIEKSSGYSYSVYGYMNVETKEYYSKETIQWEIKAHNRTGTVEQMDANVEAMARDLQEILRLSSEQKRLWDRYERR